MKRILYWLIAIIYIILIIMSVFFFPPTTEQSSNFLPIVLRISCWIVGLLIICIKYLKWNKK